MLALLQDFSRPESNSQGQLQQLGHAIAEAFLHLTLNNRIYSMFGSHIFFFWTEPTWFCKEFLGTTLPNKNSRTLRPR